MNQYVYFSELPVGTLFAYNGNACKKVSTRTALYVEYNRRFYFRRSDLCVVGIHNRIEA